MHLSELNCNRNKPKKTYQYDRDLCGLDDYTSKCSEVFQGPSCQILRVTLKSKKFDVLCCSQYILRVDVLGASMTL